MCGRARFVCSAEDVSAATGIPVNELDARWINRGLYSPIVNAMPAAWIPVVRVGEDGRRVVESMKWGLIPSFTKPEERPDHFKMFNARSETIASKSIFSRLLDRRRCVVLVNGFYEWKELSNKTKQPYYVHLSTPKAAAAAAAEGGSGGGKGGVNGGGGAVGKGEGPMLRMAGLWDTWRDPDGNQVHSCTMITVESAPRLSWLHDRMPALLVTDADVAAWLEGGEGVGANLKVIRPYNGEDLSWHPVTQSMSKPSYQGSDAWKDARTAKGSIMNFFTKSPAKPKAPLAGGSGSGEKAAAGGSGEKTGGDKKAAAGGSGSGGVKAEGAEVTQEVAATADKAQKGAAAAAAPAGEGEGAAAVAVKAEETAAAAEAAAAAAAADSGRGQKRAAEEQAAAIGGGKEEGACSAEKKPRPLPAGGVLNSL